MLVYRFLEESELKNILAKQTSSLGNFYDAKDYECNSHKYKKGYKYLHFFKDKNNISYIANFHNNKKAEATFFVATFDIPIWILLKTKGKGFYFASGYDVDYVSLREYAIPTTSFNPNWLISYVQHKGYQQPAEKINT